MRSLSGRPWRGARVPDPVVIEKEMALTESDFFRILPSALGTDAYDVAGRVVTLEEEARALTIEIGAEGMRQIALMQIPKMSVRLTFAGYDDGARDAALARFWRYFQKGGG